MPLTIKLLSNQRHRNAPGNVPAPARPRLRLQASGCERQPQDQALPGRPQGHHARAQECLQVGDHLPLELSMIFHEISPHQQYY